MIIKHQFTKDIYQVLIDLLKIQFSYFERFNNASKFI